MSFAVQSAQSLYARMLQSREMERQRKLEQQRYDDQQSMQTQEMALRQADAADALKAKTFDRQMAVAKLQQKNAALLGRAYSGGYQTPAMEEYAKASYDAGRVASGNMHAERAAKSREQDIKMADVSLGYAKELGSSLRDTDIRGTDQGYAAYNKALGSGENLFERTPYSERFPPKAGGRSDAPSMADVAEGLRGSAKNYHNIFGQPGPELNRLLSAAQYAEMLHVSGMPIQQQQEDFKRMFPDVAAGQFPQSYGQSSAPPPPPASGGATSNPNDKEGAVLQGLMQQLGLQ